MLWSASAAAVSPRTLPLCHSATLPLQTPLAPAREGPALRPPDPKSPKTRPNIVTSRCPPEPAALLGRMPDAPPACPDGAPNQTSAPVGPADSDAVPPTSPARSRASADGV